jgi:outer membrane protein OmpA-like peptidoglycan-associated protein
MHPDGRTLYFSSEGHNSMGGYDLFKTVYENGQWTKPENLGYPINTPDNDVYFVLSADGRHGYYASAKSGGEGEKDIYLITILGPIKPVMQNNEDNLIASIARPTEDVVVEKKEVKKVRLTILKGTVKDQATLEPLEAQITIIDNEKNEVINKLNTNGITGKYLATLPSGKNYGIRVEKENYSFHSENFIIPPAQDYQEITKDILLQNLEVGTNIVLENIFFDFDKATLRDESQAELEKLLEFMENNSNIRVEISGHTDSYGSDDYNKDLSNRRAESVVNWLKKHGISETRLEYKGYGEEKPRATNDTEEGRQLNRRVEMTIIE